MKACTECGRPALFNTRERSEMRADADHSLCQRCFRDILQPIQAVSPSPRYSAVNPKRVKPCAAPASRWEIKLDKLAVLSDTPIPTRPWPHTLGQENNLKGSIFGRLTVIGLSIDKLGGRWVCQCTCGKYMHRRALTLKRAPVGRSEHMCDRCAAVEKNIHKEAVRETVEQ